MSEGEQDRRETLAEIVAEIYRSVESMGDELPYTVSAGTVRKVAARIVDATKREVASTTEKSSAVGNAAAMLKALEDVLEKIDRWRTDGVIEHWQYSQLFDIADSALSAPPRNCDRFASAGEAWDAYDEWVESYRSKGQVEPFNEFGWLLAPAEKREGENK